MRKYGKIVEIELLESCFITIPGWEKKTTKLQTYADLANELQLDGILLGEGVLDLIQSGAKYAREGVMKKIKEIWKSVDGQTLS